MYTWTMDPSDEGTHALMHRLKLVELVNWIDCYIYLIIKMAWIYTYIYYIHVYKRKSILTIEWQLTLFLNKRNVFAFEFIHSV